MYDFALISTLLIYLTYFPKKVGHISHNFLLWIIIEPSPSYFLHKKEKIKSLTKKRTYLFKLYDHFIWGQNFPNRILLWQNLRLPTIASVRSLVVLMPLPHTVHQINLCSCEWMENCWGWVTTPSIVWNCGTDWCIYRSDWPQEEEMAFSVRSIWSKLVNTRWRRHQRRANYWISLLG